MKRALKKIFLLLLLIDSAYSYAQIPTFVKTTNRKKEDTILIYNPYTTRHYTNIGNGNGMLSDDSAIIDDPFGSDPNLFVPNPGDMIPEKDVLKLAAKNCKLIDWNNISSIILPSAVTLPPSSVIPLYTYVKNNIYYQFDAKKNIHGVVVVEFKLDSTDSKVLYPRIYKSLYPSLDSEAIRLIENMPNWNWGHRNKNWKQGDSLIVKDFRYRILVKF